MADFQGIAKQFVDHYYSTFDANRAQLAGLYRDNSMLTFESAQSLGTNAIAEKLTSLPFQKVIHKISTLDAQPTATGGIIILVTGQLLVDDGEHPLSYTQTFHLTQDPAGAWFVFNDLFKLIMG
ncbi:uncharacterized protein B0H64DRAFT_407104 [Chaetomium fimeti]|uniref:Nuclear transport factor 2 n=1 Tax=Chaetomium fimeti TaxID=1854472 RepID=A0AAE0LPG4_9PEZI|nr:hypothetical protein B0H64DRAFT_407104 [Chaetomium fimeti]